VARSRDLTGFDRFEAEAASSAQLVVRLYDALLDDLRQARTSIRRGERERLDVLLAHGQDVAVELLTTLDSELDAGLAHHLSERHEQLLACLARARASGDAALVDEAAALVQPLRDSWAHAVELVAASS
jgi:flagellar biosynthetic protein FliS